VSVEFAVANKVARVTLNRPDALNAVDAALSVAAGAALERAAQDPQVRVVIVTGAGRAFCAGADLKEIAAGRNIYDPDHREWDFAGIVRHWIPKPADQGGRVSLRIHRSDKPMIAAINGPAAGVGVTMTLPADIRIASVTAKFGFVFTRRGLVPEACSTWFLPRVVGMSTALEWTLGGRMVPAAEALERGLVREVWSHVPPVRSIVRVFARSSGRTWSCA